MGRTTGESQISLRLCAMKETIEVIVSMKRSRCCIYLHAHTDDWQFFQTPNICRDVDSGYYVTIIVVSASVPTPQSYATNTYSEYGFAREEGNKASIAMLTEESCWSNERITVQGHDISTNNFGNLSLVSMKLPTCATGQLLCGTDPEVARTTGYGWPAFNCESLGQLRDSGKPIRAIDSSTSYSSWNDMIDTLQGIIERVHRDRSVWLNAPEFDRLLNPHDHPDHYAVADAAKILSDKLACTTILYSGYDIANRPVNLDAHGQEIKRKLFQTYTKKVVELYGSDPDYDVNSPQYNAFLLRTYFRPLAPIK